MPKKRFQKYFDYIVVGQGLAGTLISHLLIKQGKTVLVIDNHPQYSSSKVSAGIINYITGRRFVKTWMADALIPFAKNTYLELEILLNRQFYYSLPIYKPIFTTEELQELTAVIEKNGLTEGLSFETETEGAFLQPHKAAIVVHNTGFVHVKPLIDSWRNYLMRQKYFLEDYFDYTALQLSPAGVEYKAYDAKKIIFCEGYQTINNPFFNYLPLNPTQGDTITIKISGNINYNHIVSKGIYVVPLGENIYKIGATYLWDTKDPAPTARGKDELIAKLEKIIKVPYIVLAHEAGVRPAVKDRRPLLGLHPQHPQLVIFNGLGTKGVALAPYFAAQLLQHIENDVPLLKEVDIKRFL